MVYASSYNAYAAPSAKNFTDSMALPTKVLRTQTRTCFTDTASAVDTPIFIYLPKRSPPDGRKYPSTTREADEGRSTHQTFIMEWLISYLLISILMSIFSDIGECMEYITVLV